MARDTTNYESIEESRPPHHEDEEEEEEEEPKVSTLELFSDLVMVVSIHVVAEPLEEEDAGWDHFNLYFLRVFFLWLVWHMVTLFMNAAVKMKTQNCPIYNSTMFIWMAIVLQMAQAFQKHNDRVAVLWYLLLRCFETLWFARQVYYPFKAITLENGQRVPAVSTEWLASMQQFTLLMVGTLVLCEILPLTLALSMTSNKDGGLYFPAVYASVLLIVVSFVGGATNIFSRNNKKMLSNAFDTDHLQERYELITLIFTGELCFAAGKQGNSMASRSVMVMAFITYLCTFKSHPLKGHVKFWARSLLHSVAGLFLYAGVFCAIPAMGSAFARIVESGSVEEEREGGEGLEKEEEGTISAGSLLCYSAGAFLVCTALINIINKDPTGGCAPKMTALSRGVVRILAGVIIMSMTWWVPADILVGGAPLVTVLVPLVAGISTTIEIQAVGSLQIAI